MRHVTLAACLGLALGAGAWAQDCNLAGEVSDLAGAVDARVTALASPADKAARKEAKKLSKAAVKLTGFGDSDLRGDLKALGAALKQVVKSGTADGAILADAAGLLTAAACAVEQDAALSQELADRLSDPALRAKVAKKLTRADELLDAARAAIGDDAIAAAKDLLTATGLYDAAAKKAQKLLDKELRNPGPIPEGLRIRNDFLQGALRNETGDEVIVFDFLWDVRSFADGELFDRAKGRATTTPTTDITAPVRPPYALAHLNNYAPQFWWDLDVPAPGGSTSVDIVGTVTWITSLGTFEGDVDFSYVIP